MQSALLIMLVWVKLASGSKKGARSGEGGGEGRGHLFVGIDLCGGGAGDPRCSPVPGRGGGEEGAPGPGDGAPEETRGQSSPAAGRTPLSRSVKLNKEGICVFLTSAGYLIDS